MTEVPRYIPDISERSDFDSSFSNVRTIPYHLRRRVLKQIKHEEGTIPEKLWTDRARAVEIYVMDVLETQKEVIDHIELNEKWDKEGPDGKIHNVCSLPISSVLIEIKSSSLELKNGKQKIRDEMFEEEIRATMIGPWLPWKMNSEMKKKSKIWCQTPDAEKESIISQRLTDKGIILINGGEKNRKEKTPREILDDSFYPQLNRIIQKALREQIPEKSGQLVLFPPVVAEAKNLLEVA